jgi:hypothetical protein
LKLLPHVTEAPPVLFLLDELLSGTNSEDRRAGAEAVLRRLVDTRAIGLVTTHDLALRSVADGRARWISAPVYVASYASASWSGKSGIASGRTTHEPHTSIGGCNYRHCD